METFLSVPLRPAAVQIIESDAGIVLRRGVTQVLIEGTHAADLIRLILTAAGRDGGATPEQLCALFPDQERDEILRLLRALHSRRILMQSGETTESIGAEESNLDLYQWQFGRTAVEVETDLDKVSLLAVGLNRMTERLVLALRGAGFKQIEVIDDPMLRNPEVPSSLDHWHSMEWGEVQLQSGSITCLIAGSDFGGQKLLLPWNRLCLRYGVNFFPVVLQEMVGWVGPYVIPGHTACLECLRARQNSHLTSPYERRLHEDVAAQGQSLAAWHPSMLHVTADVAAFELHRFHAKLPRWKVGKAIQVHLLSSTMNVRKVFRAPRCVACSSLHEAIPTNIHKLQPLSVIQSRA